MSDNELDGWSVDALGVDNFDENDAGISWEAADIVDDAVETITLMINSALRGASSSVMPEFEFDEGWQTDHTEFTDRGKTRFDVNIPGVGYFNIEVTGWPVDT